MASRAFERSATGMERDLVTPEGVRLTIRLATAGARAGAFVIDGLIIIAALVVLTLLSIFAFDSSTQAGGSIPAIIWLLGWFLIRNFYFTLFESSARAATPGKRMFKLRVVARDGGRLTAAAVIARNLVREIEVYLPMVFVLMGMAEGFVDQWTAWLAFAWTAIFLFMPLTNRDKLRAGDLIAGTAVIENERRKIGEDLIAAPPVAKEAVEFTSQELEVYGEYELKRLEEVLRSGNAEARGHVADAIRGKIDRWDNLGDDAFLDAYYRALRQNLERRRLLGRQKRDKFDTAR